MSNAFGKLPKPAIIEPAVIAKTGTREVEKQVKLKPNIEPTKSLDKSDACDGMTAVTYLGNEKVDVHDAYINLDIIAALSADNETEWSDDEFEPTGPDIFNESREYITCLSTLATDETPDVIAKFMPGISGTENLKDLNPIGLSPPLIRVLTQKQIFRANNSLVDPNEVVRAPLAIPVSGRKFQTIRYKGIGNYELISKLFERTRNLRIPWDSISAVKLRCVSLHTQRTENNVNERERFVDDRSNNRR